MSIVFAPGFRGGQRFHDTISYRTSLGSGGSQSSHTFSAVDIGSAAANRIVVVWVFTFDGGFSSRTISGVTIGGSAATLVAGTNVAVSSNAGGFYYLAVAAGTTANIAVTLSGSVASGLAIAVWATYGVQSWTPIGATTASGTTGTSKSTSLIPTASGGLAIGAMALQSAVTPSITFTGITQDYNTTFPNNNFPGFGGSQVTNGSSVSIGATWTGNSASIASIFSVG